MDGQFTGFITKEGKNFIYTSTERTGPGFSAFKASADRPAQRMRPLTSYPVSQSRVLPTNHEAGHVFSPTRKVGSVFFRTPVYCDYSPCFTDPTLLSVVGFLWTVKLPVRHNTKNQPIACLSDQQAGHVTHRTPSVSKNSSQGLPQQLSNLQIRRAIKEIP